MKTRAFSLVELMVAVAIVSILAAISKTMFAEFQYTAKKKEAWAVVDGIITAQWAHYGSDDEFVDCSVLPRTVSNVDMVAVSWPANAGGFDTIGWAPDGAVRGAYYCSVAPSAGVQLVCAGAIDPDGDGVGDVYAQVISDSQASLSPYLFLPLQWLYRPAYAASGSASRSVHLTDVSMSGASPSSVTSSVLSSVGSSGGGGGGEKSSSNSESSSSSKSNKGKGKGKGKGKSKGKSNGKSQGNSNKSSKGKKK